MWAWVNIPLPMIPSYISSLVAFDVQVNAKVDTFKFKSYGRDPKKIKIWSEVVQWRDLIFQAEGG